MYIPVKPLLQSKCNKHFHHPPEKFPSTPMNPFLTIVPTGTDHLLSLYFSSHFLEFNISGISMHQEGGPPKKQNYL